MNQTSEVRKGVCTVILICPKWDLESKEPHVRFSFKMLVMLFMDASSSSRLTCVDRVPEHKASPTWRDGSYDGDIQY